MASKPTYPECGSESIARIQWGRPIWTEELKRGEWPEVQLEFRNLRVFNFANFKDPDPIWHGIIEKTDRG